MRSIWSTDGILIDATTPGQSGFECNGNEGVHHTPQIPNTRSSPSDAF